MSPRVVIVTPPVVKPSEPGLSAAAAAQVLRAHGVSARALDASIGWHRRLLARDRLEGILRTLSPERHSPGELLAFRRAARTAAERPAQLQRWETYASRARYSSAVTNLEKALELASRPFPGVALRVADVEVEGHPLQSARAVARLAARESPFDDYFREELIPALRAAGATHVGVSLTFQNQVWAAFRLSALLREQAPELVRLLGGPLLPCWRAAGAPLEGEPFTLFDRLFPEGSERELAGLALELGGRADPAPTGPLAVGSEEVPWDAYLVPEPTVPAALGRGCSWRRCTFCPDHLHARHRPCLETSLDGWLHGLAERFPRGAMIHLTDSALPAGHLAHLARVIRRERLPLRWHGFVRVEPAFADPAFARELAAGGCAMLQLGIESGSARLLELMGKGAGPELARAVLRSLHGAGIGNQVYLLFGLPTETDEDREQTLRFVEEEAGTIADLNHAILNLPKGSPMHRLPARFGITEILPFHEGTELSLYDDFRCGPSHPRVEARRWLHHRFHKSEAVKGIVGDLRAPFKANHACFLPAPSAAGRSAAG